MATLDAQFLRGEQAQALEETCTTGSISKFDSCLSSILSTIPETRVIDFVTCLCLAITSGPHHALLHHLITVHQVPVTQRALHTAMQMSLPHADKTALLDILLDNAEDVDANAQPDGCRTLLEYCREDAPLASYFLRRGADPNLGTRRGFSSGSYYSRYWLLQDSGITLAHAILWGKVDVVDVLVKGGAKLDVAGAVHYAVERGDEEMLDKVLELGGDIEQVIHAYIHKKRLVSTPLYRAVKLGKLDMVRILLRHGASVLGKGGEHLSVSEVMSRNGENRDRYGNLVQDAFAYYNKPKNDTTVLELVRMEGVDEQIRDAVLQAAEPEYEFVVPPQLETEGE
jgi:ankyrin repeat protein